ncbi:pyridoxamine 5'-phosphate oxidase family protein [soil metagenome]
MSTDAEINDKFWKAVKSDMTVMLALDGAEESHAQPMTAQFDKDQPQGPIWFFTSKETDLVRALGSRQGAMMQFVAKDHDLFACLSGTLTADNDRATIDRLWNPFVAAWFEGGKDDPKLQLIRFDAEDGRVWLNDHSLFAAVKLLFGRDPKESYKDKVAEIRPH